MADEKQHIEHETLSMNARDKTMFTLGYVYRAAQALREDGLFEDLSVMDLARVLLESVLRERGF